jgi:CubicO group peptidase (beta-lactamase class C family)
MAQKSDRLALEIDRVIDGALGRERIVGTVVLVSVDGKLIYHRAAGMADREARCAMQEDSIFLLASVTKVISAVTALALIEDGRIRLDDPVTEWIPEFRPRLADGREPVITLRHLMTHTSGLDYGFDLRRTDYQAAGISNGLDLPGLSMDAALKRLASVPLLFAPGTGWNYSLSMDVLGEVLARAERRPLPQVVRSRVTLPLGMTDTDYHVQDSSRLATPYVDALPRPVRMRDPHVAPTRLGACRFSPSRISNPDSYPSAGAGMAGTAADLLRLLEAIRLGGAPVLKPQSTQALCSNALPEEIAYQPAGWPFGEPGATFGLGVSVLYDCTLTRTPHDPGTLRGGGAYGHDWFVNPTKKLSVVVFTNTAFEGCEGAYPIDVRDAVYHALFADDPV